MNTPPPSFELPELTVWFVISWITDWKPANPAVKTGRRRAKEKKLQLQACCDNTDHSYMLILWSCLPDSESLTAWWWGLMSQHALHLDPKWTAVPSSVLTDPPPTPQHALRTCGQDACRLQDRRSGRPRAQMACHHHVWKSVLTSWPPIFTQIN